MAAAVTTGREFRPFRSSNERPRNLQNIGSYDDDEEEGLVVEQPVRKVQNNSVKNENISPSNSRKRPRSLSPQDSLRQSQYRHQRPPKSESWPSPQRPRQHKEDSPSSSYTHNNRDDSRQHFSSSNDRSRQHNNKSNLNDRDNMCNTNTPSRRISDSTFRSRDSNSHRNAPDRNWVQKDYKPWQQQQHRRQERNEADYRPNDRGEFRPNDNGDYNGRNPPALREDVMRDRIERMPEDRRDRNDRRPERGMDHNRRSNAHNACDRQDSFRRQHEDRGDNFRENSFRRPHEDSRDNTRENWRDTNETPSRSRGSYDDRYPQQKERNNGDHHREQSRSRDERYQNERPRDQDQDFHLHKGSSWDESTNGHFQSRTPLNEDRGNADYQGEQQRYRDDRYRSEQSRDQGFHPHDRNSWSESNSQSQLQSRPLLNEEPRSKRNERDRYIEPRGRSRHNELQNRQPRPLPSSSSPPMREHNHNSPTNDYRRSYTDDTANSERWQSRDEYQDNVNRSRRAVEDRYLDRNKSYNNYQSQPVGYNSQTRRVDLNPRSQEEEDRRYELSAKMEHGHCAGKQVQQQERPSLDANAAANIDRAVPNTVLESKNLEKQELIITAVVQPKKLVQTEEKTLVSSTKSKQPTTAATKPLTMVKKIEPAKKSTLGIPMRWLKPKKKKPIKKTVPKEQSNMEKKKLEKKAEVAKIPRVKKPSVRKVDKRIGLTSWPSSRSPSMNRMVTDSEGGSTLSTIKDIVADSIESNRSKPKVPSAIVTKLPSNTKAETNEDDLSKSDNDSSLDGVKGASKAPSVLRANTYSSAESANSSSSDESDTDDEEVMKWASKMFGVPLRSSNGSTSGLREPAPEEPSPSKKLRLKLKIPRPEPKHQELMVSMPSDRLKKKKKSKKLKRKRIMDGENEVVLPTKKRKGKKKERKSIGSDSQTYEETEKERVRKESKEAAKPLTAEQIKAILGEDDFVAPGGSNWVRRSVRQPSKALLNAKPLRMLIEKLKHNDPDIVVLKMKKYINDPNIPSVVLDAALDALEENTNCQILYIQNFNEGMRDDQVLHLLQILQNPKCKIWCLNIGENYNVKTRTWNKFTKGLKKTKITHMYASEHTITTEMKDDIRATIRNNRKKHDRHINPDNLHVIVQCTHCWWNPINAKVLRPYLKKEGFEHILTDKEAQGLRGSSSGGPSI